MKDKLGDRMKRYEAVSDSKLLVKTPVIIRIDGKAFHTLTKNLDSPFDELFTKAMNKTMMKLCKEVPNTRFGYVQSDEISLCLLEPSVYSDAWFDNRLSKLCSIAAATATLAFHQAMRTEMDALKEVLDETAIETDFEPKYQALLDQAVFDARAFNLPPHEVINYFIWRQQDCRRNAILRVGQEFFTQKGINRLQTTGILQKLKTDLDWDFEEKVMTCYKLGRCCYRTEIIRPSQDESGVLRYDYQLDEEPPIFSEDRAYITDCLVLEETC